jgi:glucosamine--fructose-6-phosphate aminotransferase (isomerizing)
MCGIVAYIGKRNAVDVLLNGLKRVEYRGYDSAGVAVLYDGHLSLLKSAGKVDNLVQRVNGNWPGKVCNAVHAGIAHTRWATHGPPNDVNAHPHLDASGDLAIVHNGIIENYASLKQQLESRGHSFLSETDTEVLAHLIGEFYQGDLLAAVCEALQHTEGTFGLAILSARHPDTLIAARRGSPILIGLGAEEKIVASDAAAILAHTRQVIYLDDDDVAVVTPTDVDIRDLNRFPVARETASIQWDSAASEKGGFEHYMLKEIYDQPQSLRDTIRGRLDLHLGTALLSGLDMTPRDIVDIGRLITIACGTSLHAGLVGEYYFEALADLPTDVDQAAEFRYRNPIISSRDLVVAVSQSGETADTLAAVREARQKGALIVGICNVVGSTIARETGRGVYLHAGPEIGVASTKAFTAQVTVLLMMALKFGRCRRLSRERGIEICREIQQIPDKVERVLEQNDHIARVAEACVNAEHAFFIGRGYLYPIALEGALKLKEISYIHAEGYHAAELKHGPIALLQPDVPVVALANDVPGKTKTLSNIEECRARHTPVIAVHTQGDDCVEQLASHTIEVPPSSPLVAPITTAAALQLLAYHVARYRGCEIDQPRNLAKSVTVE